jgi:hypothetical protein
VGNVADIVQLPDAEISTDNAASSPTTTPSRQHPAPQRRSALEDPEMRRDALNRYLRTPTYTYEAILRESHPAGILAAADARPTRGSEESSRERSQGEGGQREMQFHQITRPDRPRIATEAGLSAGEDRDSSSLLQHIMSYAMQ